MSELRPMTSILFPKQPAPFEVVDSEAREGVRQLSEENGVPYPLKDGMYNTDTTSIIISNGNHVTLNATEMGDTTFDLHKGVFGSYNFTDSLFSLKPGDVVTRKLKNIVVPESIPQKYMIVNMYGSNGEKKFNDANINVQLVGAEVEDTITITEEIDVGSLIFWLGGNAAMHFTGTVEFDVYLYVNGERYV